MQLHVSSRYACLLCRPTISLSYYFYRLWYIFMLQYVMVKHAGDDDARDFERRTSLVQQSAGCSIAGLPDIIA